MSLKNLVIETGSVDYNGQSIELRGITSNDVKTILTRNRLSVDMLFNVAERRGIKSPEDLTNTNIQEVAMTAISELPELVAAVIAQSSGDITQASIAETLPINIQFDCLREIARLTFTNAVNFGQFLGNVMSVARMVRTIPTVKAKITNGELPANAGTPA